MGIIHQPITKTSVSSHYQNNRTVLCPVSSTTWPPMILTIKVDQMIIPLRWRFCRCNIPKVQCRPRNRSILQCFSRYAHSSVITNPSCHNPNQTPNQVVTLFILVSWMIPTNPPAAAPMPFHANISGISSRTKYGSLNSLPSKPTA